MTTAQTASENTLLVSSQRHPVTDEPLTYGRIKVDAAAHGAQLIHTEWPGTDGLIWTWQDMSSTLDTREATYRTRRAALEAWADWMHYRHLLDA